LPLGRVAILRPVLLSITPSSFLASFGTSSQAMLGDLEDFLELPLDEQLEITP